MRLVGASRASRAMVCTIPVVMASSASTRMGGTIVGLARVVEACGGGGKVRVVFAAGARG